MFDWLQRKIDEVTIKSAIDDIGRFNMRLIGASDAEVSSIVAIATLLRLNLEALGKLPRQAIDLSRYRDEALCSAVQLSLGSLVKQYQKNDNPYDASGAMVWLHTVRAMNIPEIRIMGRQMWKELGRGFDLASIAALELEILTGKSLPRASETDFAFTPPGLEADRHDEQVILAINNRNRLIGKIIEITDGRLRKYIVETDKPDNTQSEYQEILNGIKNEYIEYIEYTSTREIQNKLQKATNLITQHMIMTYYTYVDQVGEKPIYNRTRNEITEIFMGKEFRDKIDFSIRLSNLLHRLKVV